jgi:hypothetical protein
MTPLIEHDSLLTLVQHHSAVMAEDSDEDVVFTVRLHVISSVIQVLRTVDMQIL